jgi:hypothetical protein
MGTAARCIIRATLCSRGRREPVAHFEVIRNLPHAATIARRIEARLAAARAAENSEAGELLDALADLRETLEPYEDGGDPPEPEAIAVADEAAAAARRLVDEIERLTLGEDRLGQAVRNLFECLGMGEEGAEISLRAGENPGSLMRPV